MQLVTRLLMCIRLSFPRTDTAVPQLLSSAPPDLPDHEALDLILQQLKQQHGQTWSQPLWTFTFYSVACLPLSLPGSITHYAIFKRSQTVLPGIYVLAWFMLIYRMWLVSWLALCLLCQQQHKPNTCVGGHDIWNAISIKFLPTGVLAHGTL